MSWFTRRRRKKRSDDYEAAIIQREEAKKRREAAERITRALTEDRGRNGYADMVMKAMGTRR